MTGKSLNLLFTLFLISFISNCQVTSNLQMVWNDEFNGNSLDASKWDYCPEWFRQGRSYWSDDNVEMTGNGQVKLKVTEQNGTVKCGAIRTHNKFDKKYGYFEVRCKVPQLRGGWAAFWMMPYGNQPGNWGNDGTEIDVFESINGWQGKINHALHWDGYGAEHQKESYRFDRQDLYDNNYHLFGVMWTPDEYVFYIDNQETWRTTAGGVADVNQYLKLTMEVASGWWAGNWDDQVTKPIEWLVDYVRVYDYEPISQPDVNLSFQMLSNNNTFNVNDHVQMHVDVSGNLSQIDEIKFFTQKGSNAEILKKTSAVNAATTYWYNWYPDEAGDYTLKAKGFKNGNYVTNVVVNATVNSNQVPLSLEFESLNSGGNYLIGDQVNMDINLLGNLSDADEIQFLVKKDAGSFEIQNTQSINGNTLYNYNWSPSEAGSYSLRVTANLNGQYVTHVVVGSITVSAPQNPLSLNFASLNSGATFTEGDIVNMDVELTGNLADADELQFLTKKGDNAFIIQNSQNINGNSIAYDWTAAEAGNYSLRVTANKNGQYVTHTVVGAINIEAASDPLSLNFSSLNSGTVFQITDVVTMDVDLSGNLNDADELQFLVKKDDGAFEIQQTVNVTEANHYNYNWAPTEHGSYSLRVTANKNGGYVTHVVVGAITVEDPFVMTYKFLQNESVYNVGDGIKMHVDLSGDFSAIDELKFMVKKGTESWNIIKTATVTQDEITYRKKWTPTEIGAFKLKVSAYSNGAYVTHINANVTIIDPIRLSFKSLETGQVYSVGDDVKMHVDILGDLSEADEIKFIVQKIGENNVVDKISTITPGVTVYYNKWTPTEAGEYSLKAKAFLGGEFVVKTVAHITVEASNLERLVSNSLELEDKLSIRVYPNPVFEILNIETHLEDVNFKIFDSVGKQVLIGNGKSVDISNLPNGSYFISINNSAVAKFIK